MFHNLRLAVAVQFALDGKAEIKLCRTEADDSPWLCINWEDEDGQDLFRAYLERQRTGALEWRELRAGEFWIR